MTAPDRYASTWSVDNGTVYSGVESSTHNGALRRTRHLFSGQGFKVVREESSTGHLVMDNGTNRAVINVKRVGA